MRYELLLQPREVGAAFDPAPIEAALEAKQVRRRPDGVWVWALAAGEIELGPVKEGGKPIAYEVGVPYGDRDALVRQAFTAALELAEAGGVKVVDPTLGRALRIEDEGAVMESFLSASRYAGEFMGVGSAVGIRYAPKVEEEGLSAGVRVMLALIVFAVFAFLGWRLLSR